MDKGKSENTNQEIKVDTNKPAQPNFLTKVRENPWIAASIVLGVVVIFLLFFNKSGSINANVVNENTATQNLMDFIESQGVEAEFKSAEKQDAFWKMTVDIDGQEVPVYVSLDGKYLVANPIPLSGADSADSTDNSDTETQPPQEVPKSDKPVVEMFVMSHCPYGTQIEKGMIPVVEALGDKIDFENKFVYYAMHGETEVKEQLNQYCIQKEQNNLYLDYLKCFLEEGKGDACLTETKINKAKLETCTKAADTEFSVTKNFEDQAGWLSGRFPKFDIYKADNEKYDVAGSPTLVVNGETVSSGRDSASLLKAVCNAFNTAPEECDTVLSSASPSPGFGFSTTTTGTTADAQCG